MVTVDLKNQLVLMNVDGRHEVWLRKEECYQLIFELLIAAEMAYPRTEYREVTKNEVYKLFGESQD